MYKAKTTNITPNPLQICSLQQLSPAILLFPSMFTDGIVVLLCKLQSLDALKVCMNYSER